MKRLILLLLMGFSLSINANVFGQNNAFLFKDYPFDMHKIDFQKAFKQFGECQFSMGSDVLCARRGEEQLYGIPFNIMVYFEKNRTHKITLKTVEPINKHTYLELFRGMIKSGFELYELKDENGKVNVYDEIFSNGGKDFQALADKKLDDLEVEENKTNKATLYYTDHKTMQKLLKSRQKFSSAQDIFSKVPVDTRFVEMSVDNYKGLYTLELIFTIPNASVTTIDDRPTEKF
ncbi:hypothetical protein A6B39_00535 [Mannheimia granulomatis]|uniref:hypothetical protein n=1 Tax=Mannheimia granulomatis TaxID=85402 RepID=UPI00159DA2CD|nr:hypothetical protein [Mannheimia granulomatis]QLB14039.1 hypothetical protein A6B39_00535 [Mannheimia granulomatis]